MIGNSRRDIEVAMVELEVLREVVHPPGKLASRAEHWAGRAYMRKISLRVTRVLVPTRITPNQITVVMTVAGILSGAALLLPGLAGALLSVILMQVYLLLDCVDGEVARWRNQPSVLGVYMDRLGAYLANLAVMVGMGLRASSLGIDLYLVAGLVAGIGGLLLQSTSDLVSVARTNSLLGTSSDQDVVPRSAGLARIRALASGTGIHRLANGIECTLLLLVAAIADVFMGGLAVTHAVCLVVTALILVLVPAHIVSIVSSSRLK